MNPPESRKRRVGAIEVTPLWDGPLTTSFDKIPDPAHRAEAERLIVKAPSDALTMNVYGFLVRSGDEVALIDAGAGRLVNPDLGKLASALRALGVAQEQVKHIFITHAHRDHYGGLVNEKGEAAFPNAELVLHKKEAGFWFDTSVEDMPPRARANLESMRHCFAPYLGRIRRVEDNEGVMGVAAHLAPGHTPGHTCWIIRSDGEALLAWGDIIHIAYIHLPAPHIAMEYDLDPKMAGESRRRVLDWVAKDGIAVAGAHLPSSGIGTIVHDGASYAFRPDR
jgi:glyoxylase-like metal-dependent hydrolase (beta-lactamase superfamily II)